jgi:hypothetical protein
MHGIKRVVTVLVAFHEYLRIRRVAAEQLDELGDLHFQILLG